MYKPDHQPAVRSGVNHRFLDLDKNTFAPKGGPLLGTGRPSLISVPSVGEAAAAVVGEVKSNLGAGAPEFVPLAQQLQELG